jgi:formiminotetrahydrofolate cyclodeaminase
MMDDLTKLGVDELLDRTADRTPTPGGGSVTGLAGALSCALGRMVAAYSVNQKTEPQVREQVEGFARRFHRADQLLRALITRDATAYANMIEAARERKKARATGHAEQIGVAQKAYEKTVLAALAVPMEMAALVSNALATMDEFKPVASRYLLSDLGIAAVLADATARTARYTVWVNARELNDTTKRTRIEREIDEIVAHCAGHRESVEGFVRSHLEQGGPVSR